MRTVAAPESTTPWMYESCGQSAMLEKVIPYGQFAGIDGGGWVVTDTQFTCDGGATRFQAMSTVRRGQERPWASWLTESVQACPLHCPVATVT